MENPVLEVKNLKTSVIKKQVEYHAVDGVTLSIQPGEIVGLVGESGCGKSMTSLSIMGLLPNRFTRIVDGDIVMDGVNLAHLSDRDMKRYRGKQIAMIFQDPMTALNPTMTVQAQITEVLRAHERLSKHEAVERVVEILQTVGVPRAREILQEYPHQLSGGLRQRVMIAMAMVCRPKLLIADEPTTALDVTVQTQVLDLMRDMRDEFGTSIILITHDLGVVADIADRVLVMYAGQIVESANVEALFTSPSHPYTQGLLRAIPSLLEEQELLYSIPGRVPDSSQYPTGCRFASRCPHVMDRCIQEQPPLLSAGADHFSRCWLVNKEETCNDNAIT